MLKRQRTGSVVCPSCGSLVGVNDDRCYSCGRRNPSLWGFAPLVRSLGRDFGFLHAIMGGTIGLYLATLAASGGEGIQSTVMNPLEPSVRALVMFGASGAIAVRGFGWWWTVLSASWLHAGLLHIFFNLLWVRQLAPEIAELYGPGRAVIIYTLGGACGFALSSLMGVPVTVGASASIFALLGAAVCYGQRTGSRVVHSTALQYAIILFVFGFIARGVDNFAHGGGFAGGYAIAWLLNPLRPERGDHVLIALVCLVASAAAVAASLISSLSSPFV